MEDDHTRTPVMTILSCPYVEQRNECVQLEAFHLGTTSSMITGLQTYMYMLVRSLFVSLQYCRRCAGKQVYSQQFCSDLSIYVCLSATSTCVANLPAAAG